LQGLYTPASCCRTAVDLADNTRTVVDDDMAAALDACVGSTSRHVGGRITARTIARRA
jgi:hypothetical protein